MQRASLWFGIQVLTLASLPGVARASVVFVDASATGSANGTTWTDAFTSLQPALAVAQSGDEIWVARGAYAPAPPGGSRSVSFELKTGVAVYGGFIGGETQLSQRDFEHNLTVLTGDLNGDDGPGFANDGENSFHVVHCASTGAGTILDGFTIRGGNSTPNLLGAGVYHQSGSAAYTNLILRNNRASGGGGMFHLAGHADVTICMFAENQANFGGGLSEGSNGLFLERCLFIGNTAASSGGGFFDGYGGAQFLDCIFSGNTAQYGGAVSESDSFTKYTNCTFSRNHATTYGGGIQSNGKLGSTVYNCIFWGNTGATGSVLENQDDAIGFSTSGDGCTVQGHPSTSLVGLNGLDPLLVDPLGADGVAGTRDDDVRLQPGSPCIDASRSPSTLTPFDFAGLPRAVDDPNTPLPSIQLNTIVDRGAHEYQPCASPENYCVTSPNSVGPGSVMGFAGTASFHFNNLVLRATGNPPHVNGLFIYSQNAGSIPFGNGVLCLGSGIRRLSPTPSDAFGVAQRALDVHAPSAPFDIGEDWRFQYWYRNTAGGGAGFNLSDGLLVHFCQ